MVSVCYFITKVAGIHRCYRYCFKSLNQAH